MNILYDGYIYSIQVAGGINRYFSRLIGGLPAQDAPTMIMGGAPGLGVPAHPRLELYSYQRFSFRPGRISAWINGTLLDRQLAKCRADVLHPTYYKMIGDRSPGHYGVPTVITVHDMIHELYPAMMDPDGSRAKAKKAAIMAASAVICVSENTKRDLLRFYAIPEEMITVIYHGADSASTFVGEDEAWPRDPYYLYVGSRAPYKNFDGLLRAFAKAVSARPSLQLRVAGPPFTDDEMQMILTLKLTSQVVNHGHVDDERLASLYRGSIAFVYPSLYEGFGLPLLEAMSHKTAVVAANAASIPEVVGEAGLLFDPAKEDDLSDILTSLSDSPARREELITLGQRRVGRFTWGQTVEKTRKVYASVAA